MDRLTSTQLQQRGHVTKHPHDLTGREDAAAKQRVADLGLYGTVEERLGKVVAQVSALEEIVTIQAETISAQKRQIDILEVKAEAESEWVQEVVEAFKSDIVDLSNRTYGDSDDRNSLGLVEEFSRLTKKVDDLGKRTTTPRTAK